MASLKEATQLPGADQKVSEYELVPNITIPYPTCHDAGEVLAVRFSPDGQFLTAGSSDGSIRVFNAVTGKVAQTTEGGSLTEFPITCIRFRPKIHASKNTVFLTADASGAVRHWQMNSGECLHTFTDEANQVLALDFNEKGTQFVTGGRDAQIRVYDEATKTNLATLQGGTMGDGSATNRVFSVKFTHDENVILSGGWDNTVHVWDIRTGCSERSLFGPHICGDALDLKNTEILTGSWRSTNQLELWDFGSGQRISEVPWVTTTQSAFDDSFQYSKESCMLYAAQFSKDSIGRFIVAGGSGANEAKVFDHAADDALVGTVAGLARGVFSVDFSPDQEKVAVGSGDHCISVLDVTKKSK